MTSSPPASPPPAYTATANSAAVQPPPLPPRNSERSINQMATYDSRPSSPQSIGPAPGAQNAGRRTLLLVYIHGFMGDETSFQSFPAHLHNILTITMAESHTVHTKIYPKYRSRYQLEVARDGFSQWLTPHENAWTDVILLGHSMGGLLAADIALLFRHNIIGVVNFDVPFIGMHPGIVKAGLGSIFSPWPTPEQDPTSPEGRPGRMNTLFNPNPNDPNYNPSFYNDVHLPMRKGWENTLHFINKHSNNLIEAGKNLVKTHMQFGGAMADYPTLKARYARIRALEEDNEAVRRAANPEVRYAPRIRFVNYYTASTGRPKKPKSPKSQSPSRPASSGLLGPSHEAPAAAFNAQLPETQNPPSTAGTISPRISVEEYRGNEVVPVTPQEPLSATSPISPTSKSDEPSASTSAVESTGSGLPTVPPVPEEPPFVDISQYTDKAERKAAEKEQSGLLKEYKRAVKERNAILKKRAKEEKKSAKENPTSEATKQSEVVSNGPEAHSLDEDMDALQLGPETPQHDLNSPSPYSNYVFSRSTILAQPHPDDRSAATDSSAQSMTTSYADSTAPLSPQQSHDTTSQDADHPTKPQKKKRYKKFCMLPPKDANGNPDPTWIRVFMEGVDEVVAHTSLFFMSEAYERLVGDVAARVEEWVRENDSVRLVREMEGLR